MGADGLPIQKPHHSGELSTCNCWGSSKSSWLEEAEKPPAIAVKLPVAAPLAPELGPNKTGTRSCEKNRRSSVPVLGGAEKNAQSSRPQNNMTAHKGGPYVIRFAKHGHLIRLLSHFHVTLGGVDVAPISAFLGVQVPTELLLDVLQSRVRTSANFKRDFCAQNPAGENVQGTHMEGSSIPWYRTYVVQRL